MTPRWIVPAAVYAAILGLSSVPGDALSGPPWASYVGHLVEYTTLGAALAWAGRGWAVRVVVAAGAPLALLDELYQRTFATGRVFELRDLAIDLAGLVIGATLVRTVRGRTSGA